MFGGVTRGWGARVVPPDAGAAGEVRGGREDARDAEPLKNGPFAGSVPKFFIGINVKRSRGAKGSETDETSPTRRAVCGKTARTVR